MKALKTTIAAAVIVFALTAVAMAGVQHFTKAQASQAAAKAPTHYTVTPTARQLAPLISDQSGSHVSAAQHTRTHERRVHREYTAGHQVARKAHAQHAGRGQSSAQSSPGVQSGSHRYEPSHHTYTPGSGHSGDGGRGCGD